MDQTNPETGVAPEAVELALESQFGFAEPQAKPKVEAPEPEAPAVEETPADQASDEPTPDDIPDVEEKAAAQSADDAFEIVHNGTQHKLTRDELIKHAQQGFDYTQKTQALAEQQRQLQTSLQRAQELEVMQQALAPDLAQVKALEGQLKRYQGVDWAKAQEDDPLGTPKYWMQYQATKDAYSAAVGQFNSKAAALKEQKQALTADLVQQQQKVLLDKIPSWRDPAKFQAGAKEVAEYLAREGVPQDRIDSLTDAVAVSIAYKAAQYDKLVKAKSEKVKQLRTAQPVVKPGAVSQQVDGKTEFKKFQKDFRTAGAKGNSRAQEGLLLQKLSRTFKM